MSRPVEPQFEDAPPPPEPGRRRLRRDLLIGAGLLLVVGLLGKALSGREHGRGHSAATTSPASSPVTPVAPAPGTVIFTLGNGQVRIAPALPARTADDPSVCPATATCAPEALLPGDVVDAVRSRFPEARLAASATVTLTSRPWSGAVWFRRLVFHVGAAELRVQVRAPGPADVLGSSFAGDGTVHYAGTLHQYIVLTELHPGPASSMDTLRALTHDERLLST